MVSRYKLTIRTALGSQSGHEDANDAQQIADCMPSDVLSYSIDGVTERPGVADVDSERLWINLGQLVSIIELATMPPEFSEAQHQEQLRALGNLTFATS